MNFTWAASQVGLIPYGALAYGLYQLTRYVRGKQPAQPLEFWGVFALAGMLPMFTAALLVSVGLHELARDRTIGTYLLLNTSVVGFFFVLCAIVVFKEGWHAPSLRMVAEEVTHESVRVWFVSCFMVLAAMLIYALTVDSSIDLLCESIRCRRGERLLGLSGTNFPPLVVSGYLNSLGIGLLMSYLVRRAGAVFLDSRSA